MTSMPLYEQSELKPLALLNTKFQHALVEIETRSWLPVPKPCIEFGPF